MLLINLNTFKMQNNSFYTILELIAVNVALQAPNDRNSSSSSSTTVGSMPVGVWRHSYYRCPPLPI